MDDARFDYRSNGSILSIKAIKAIQTTNFEEDVKPRSGAYDAISEILERLNKQKALSSPGPVDEKSRKSDSSLPNQAQPFDPSRKMPEVTRQRIEWDHSYSKTDKLSDESDSTVSAEMELDPFIESIASSLIESEMGRVDADQLTGSDLVEANMKKIMGE